jgi:hypothetical protein
MTDVRVKAHARRGTRGVQAHQRHFPLARSTLPPVVFNSHGGWAPLREIREIELERGNGFPDIRGLSLDADTMWVTPKPRVALSYAFEAGEADRIMDSNEPLQPNEIEELRYLSKIRLQPTDLVIEEDGDNGYLVVRP